MQRITAIRWTQDLRHSMRPQSHPCWTAHYRRGGSKLAGVLLGAIAGLNRFSRGTTPACAVPRRALASTHRVAARPREGLSATSRHSRGGPRSGVGDKCWADQIGLCFLLRGGGSQAKRTGEDHDGEKAGVERSRGRRRPPATGRSRGTGAKSRRAPPPGLFD
jgi:hypothetical protein